MHAGPTRLSQNVHPHTVALAGGASHTGMHTRCRPSARCNREVLYLCLQPKLSVQPLGCHPHQQHAPCGPLALLGPACVHPPPRSPLTAHCNRALPLEALRRTPCQPATSSGLDLCSSCLLHSAWSGRGVGDKRGCAGRCETRGTRPASVLSARVVGLRRQACASRTPVDTAAQPLEVPPPRPLQNTSSAPCRLHGALPCVGQTEVLGRVWLRCALVEVFEWPWMFLVPSMLLCVGDCAIQAPSRCMPVLPTTSASTAAELWGIPRRPCFERKDDSFGATFCSE